MEDTTNNQSRRSILRKSGKALTGATVLGVAGTASASHCPCVNDRVVVDASPEIDVHDAIHGNVVGSADYNRDAGDVVDTGFCSHDYKWCKVDWERLDLSTSWTFKQFLREI